MTNNKLVILQLSRQVHKIALFFVCRSSREPAARTALHLCLHSLKPQPSVVQLLLLCRFDAQV